ncbi:MAG: quinol:cytochrome C oxidoreductase, partial [Bacteroidetes bacterium]|nr:quinol:cytochrome C oxidoreductase [Bacteroidota bacterium]
MYKDYKFSNQIKVLSISLILIGLLGILYGFYSAPSTVEEAKEIVASMSHDSDHGGSVYGESDYGDSDHGYESSGHEYDHDKHVFNQLHN